MRYRLTGILLLGLFFGLFIAGCTSSQSASREFTSAGSHWHKGKSVWREMAPHLRLATRSDIAHSEAQINWLARHQAYIERTTTNAAPYVFYIYQQTRKRGIPAELALLPMIESAYNPFVYSRAGATGLWQMMPGTASGFGLQIDWWYDGRRDIVASTNAALNYLEYLHKLFGNWLLAIAAYNSGEGTVANAIRHNQALHLSTSFWALPLPVETRAYVPQLLAWAAIVNNPRHYGIRLVDVPCRQPFDAVHVKRPLDIKEAAKLAHVDSEVIHQLNPGFRRSTTTPDHSYTLLLPTESVEIFKIELARAPQPSPATVNWQYHSVQPGETLSSIARKYHVSTSVLAENNHLSHYTIHPNQKLLIRKGTPNAHRVTTEEARFGADHVPGPQQTIHTVSRWDSLNRIAQHYGVSVRQIQFWNGLGRGESPQVNQKLVLWLKHPIRSFKAMHSNSHSTRYQVRSGDTLMRIAKNHRVSVQSIQAANGLKGTALRRNQWLIIPSSSHNAAILQAKSRGKTMAHTSMHSQKVKTIYVKPGQTLYSIARQYHVSPQQLMNWNHLSSARALKAGQRLVVY